jgi:hypothetical protein
LAPAGLGLAWWFIGHAITVHPSLKEASGNYSAYFLKNPFA